FLNQAYVAGVDIVAGLLDRNGEPILVLLVGSPAQLRIAQEYHAVRSPVVDDVGEDVEVHEQTCRLPGEYLIPFAVRIAQTDGRLPGIDTHAEHVELKAKLDR